jgi:hypothetical protein
LGVGGILVIVVATVEGGDGAVRPLHLFGSRVRGSGQGLRDEG